MASCSIFCAILLALCSISPRAWAQCPNHDEVFAVTPQNVTITEEGGSRTFVCNVTEVIRSRGNLFFTWEFMLVNTTQFSTVNPQAQDSIEKGFNLTSGGEVFVIKSVQTMHMGKYRCSAAFPGCLDGIVSNFNIQVVGPPVITLNNDNTVLVDTQQNLELSGTIIGFPLPSVMLMREIQGMFVELEQSVNQRFTLNFDRDTSRITLRLENVAHMDAGRYKIVAENTVATDEAVFAIMPTGPDPPVVTLSPPMLVSSFNHQVTATCSVQFFGYLTGENVTIEWRDTRNNLVPAMSSGSVYVADQNNGSAVLVISSFNRTLVGSYMCRVVNDRGEDSAELRVFGPPPSPPSEPSVSRISDNSFLIRWSQPTTSPVPITSYVVEVYASGTDDIRSNDVVNVDANRTGEITHELFTDGWMPGKYDIAIISVSGNVRAMASTQRSTFNLEGSTTSAQSFPVLVVVVVAAVVAGIIVLLVVSITVGLICYCSYNARRNKNTHQQRWGSEEDKLNRSQTTASAVQNSYTALSLHDSSELPPSPLSPMTSSIGIDPKWEFPRENIQLSDVLAEGQFTVLYKGVAKSLKDKSCEVAVKSLKEDATEDDLKALIYEMDLLSSIEEHPNIVSLVRVCSVGKPLYMVMEYMCHGDLLGFLRACRGHHGMYTVSPGNRYQPPSLQLCSRDLLNMATKIASGMRYLADRKIVHRALCTRNVLVGAGMDVKVYNVGSFDALENRDSSMVKWMAPETLYDRTNTTYSDVWSFGVTLWELVTVGGTPYAEILPEDLYAQLQSGMRMPCPTHCAQEVYNIMSACWQKNPTDRPHFAIIHDNLDELVMSKLNYLDLRSYDGYAYSQFGDESAQLSTAL